MNNDNILRPELVWIEGRCYRFGESSAWSKDRGSGAYQEESMYLENDYEESGECQEEAGDYPGADDIEVQFYGGKFKHSFYVPKPFFPFIIGTKGSMRKRLEIETSTTIYIPKFGQEGNIVLTGSSRQKVVSARRRLDNIIQSSRKKLRFTHFLSIPSNAEGIQEEFEKFKKSVLEMEPPMSGVDESVFQKTKKIHLTIEMLVLIDENESQEAIEALERCKENIIRPIILKNGPLSISLQGIDYMNDDPSEVKVLYAKLHSKDDVLQELVDKISDHFTEIGFSRKESDKVKLHVTLMNTNFKIPSDQRRGAKRETFDARRILEQYKDTKFGEFVLDTIHISRFGAVASNGYYEITGKISF